MYMLFYLVQALKIADTPYGFSLQHHTELHIVSPMVAIITYLACGDIPPVVPGI